MSDYSPVNSDSNPFTLVAGEALTGGLLVAVSADNAVTHPTDSTTRRAIGVAAFDAASGAYVSVHPLEGIHEVPVENGVSVSAGEAIVASTTPGRIASQAVYATVAGGSIAVLGICTRGTTGTAAGAVARFVGQ